MLDLVIAFARCPNLFDAILGSTPSLAASSLLLSLFVFLFFAISFSSPPAFFSSLSLSLAQSLSLSPTFPFFPSCFFLSLSLSLSLAFPLSHVQSFHLEFRYVGFEAVSHSVTKPPRCEVAREESPWPIQERFSDLRIFPFELGLFHSKGSKELTLKGRDEGSSSSL